MSVTQSTIATKKQRGVSVRCQHCDKSCVIRPYRVPEFRCCSRKCLWQWQNANRRVGKTCVVCGDEFTVISSRGKIAKYCSRPCYYKGMARVGSLRLVCAVCKVVFRRSPSHGGIGSPRQPCCSLKCRGLLTRTSEPATPATARKWLANRGLLQKCNRCGYKDHPEILVVHHRDENRQNNKLSNLEVICPNCHALEHYGGDELSGTAEPWPSGWSFEPPKVPGWYWWRNDNAIAVRHVFSNKNGLLTIEASDSLNFLAVAEVGGEWRGPLEIPHR